VSPRVIQKLNFGGADKTGTTNKKRGISGRALRNQQWRRGGPDIRTRTGSETGVLEKRKKRDHVTAKTKVCTKPLGKRKCSEGRSDPTTAMFPVRYRPFDHQGAPYTCFDKKEKKLSLFRGGGTSAHRGKGGPDWSIVERSPSPPRKKGSPMKDQLTTKTGFKRVDHTGERRQRRGSG